MNKLIQYVYDLSVLIGPRGAATKNEALAARYIADKMKETGMKVSVEEFYAPTSFSWAYGIYYILSFLGAPLYFLNPIYGLIIGTIALICFILENYTFEVASRIVPRGKSQNVIGRVMPEESAKNRIIVLAHHDTSKAALNFSPDMVKNFRTSFILMFSGMIFIPAGALLSMIFAGNHIFLTAVSVLMAASGLIVFFPIITLAHRELRLNHTNGANDNASGVSVVLGISQRLKIKPLKSTEVWCVTTGSEESGSGGMLDLLKKHREVLKGALFINLDNLGKGKVKYITKEGMIFSVKSGRRLTETVKRIIEDSEDINIEPHAFNIMNTDSLPALMRGYEAMSIMAFDDKGLLPNWHWHTDTYENVDEENLITAEKLVWQIIEQVDKE